MSLVRDMERLSADEKELHYSETELFDEYSELASTIGKCNAILIRISRPIYIHRRLRIGAHKRFSASR